MTGCDFGHRRAWIEHRLLVQAEIFSIDVCAYAVMSNHYHLVLHIDEQRSLDWSDAEVVVRWSRLHRIPEWFESSADDVKARTIEVWRERLTNISWFMKCLNEPLARMANAEDGCKGRFWEGRFKSQALLDDAAVLKCMAYVDLNPVRAGKAKGPEDSKYTSIQARIKGRDSLLAPMRDSAAGGFKLPVNKAEYLQLVAWTGRRQPTGKRALTRTCRPQIVNRLECSSPRPWLDEMQDLTRNYFRAIGKAGSLDAYCSHLGQSRLWGLVR